jgi:hypothetical protein
LIPDASIPSGTGWQPDPAVVISVTPNAATLIQTTISRVSFRNIAIVITPLAVADKLKLKICIRGIFREEDGALKEARLDFNQLTSCSPGVPVGLDGKGTSTNKTSCNMHPALPNGQIFNPNSKINPNTVLGID